MGPTVDELLIKYREALVALEEAKTSGRRNNVQKRLVDQAQVFHLMLRETADGRAGITSLVDDELETVRSWSATNALAWDEGRARPALEEMAAGGGPGSFEAKMVLSEHDKGRLRTDWVPAGAHLDSTHWATAGSSVAATATPASVDGGDESAAGAIDGFDIRRRLLAECPTIGERAAGLMQNCVRFVATAIDDEQDRPIGSKLGGTPDVPRTWEWPTWTKDDVTIPLSFVGQIDLDEVAAVSPPLPLPQAGFLSFFVDFWAMIDAPDDPSTWRVFHFEQREGLQRATHAYAEGDALESPMRPAGCAALQPIATVSLPDIFDPLLRALDPDEAELDAYERIQWSIGLAVGCGRVRHQLLGFDSGVQHPMIEQVEESYARRADAQRALDGGESSDWRLLLQVDSDDSIGLEWGDSGQIYFAARATDLREHRLGLVWFNSQW